YYQVFNYTASATGTHSFSASNVNLSAVNTQVGDPFVGIWAAGQFDPSTFCNDPDTLAYGFPDFSTTLNNGSSYDVVGLAVVPGATGTFDVVIDAPDPDADSDGVPDDQDNCPSDANPGQQD